MKFAIVLTAATFALGACTTSAPPPTATPTKPAATRKAPPKLSPKQASANFRSVVRRMEPIAESECRKRAPDLNCDFKIVLDTRRSKQPNAYQTLERNGRPVLGFNTALIAEARNADELAFVMGHETAHHIRRHLFRQRQSARGGAIVGGLIAAGLGVNVDTGAQIGGTVGARAYSKNNELEADELGTVITATAGYDPVRGAQFFTRIPDPGDKFLGTHPPNASRIGIVKRTAAKIRRK